MSPAESAAAVAEDAPLVSSLEAAARAFAVAHGRLTERVRRLTARVDELQHQATPEIKARADELTAAAGTLRAAIEDNPRAFVRPKTRVIAGVKVGFRKMRGQVSFVDEGKVIERIRARLPTEQAYMLIRVRESVDKTALADLELTDLRRIGVSVTADEDVVVIDAGEKDVARFVRALIKASGEDSVGGSA